jgi:hypothetical protein
MTKKGFSVSADPAVWTPNLLNFKRQHTGPLIWETRAKPLRPLWPIFLVAAMLILVGLLLILNAGQAVAALGGLFFAFLGLVVLAVGAYQLGSRHD